MINSKSLLPFCFICFPFFAVAQKDTTEIKYRRSSLYTLMIDDSTRPHASAIKEAFEGYPVPEKFNDHNLKNRMLSSKALMDDQTVTISAFLDTNAIARKLIEKWFNRTKKGAFDMNLISERGQYNASEMDAKVALQTKRGLALLADAGEELIQNTFVLVSDFKYMSHEEMIDKARETSDAVQKISGRTNVGFGGLSLNSGILGAALDVGKKGYLVKTTSYLYRLEWNDSVSSVFYNDFWTDSLSLDKKKVAAFNTTDIFKLTFIGKDDAWADWPSSIYTTKSEDELVGKATIQALDAVIAKLQRKHEEFRTKSPLYIDPLATKIGLKEGLEANDTYEVLEKTQTEEGKTFYNKIGTIRVDKKQIWDNRYMATGDSINPVDRTLFKKVSGKEFYQGLLIKQK